MNFIPGYSIKSKLYSSTTTIVFDAIRESDNTPVVLKTLVNDFPPITLVNRFYSEFEIMCLLKNVEGVISAYDIFENENRPVLVLENFESTTLSIILAYKKTGINDFLTTAQQIIAIIHKIHDAGVIHRDINPSNILWNKKNNTIRLIDFGISSFLNSVCDRSLKPGVLEGTLPYMSPEQTGRMNTKIDYRTDFYSLGATFYEMLTGHPPFTCDDNLEYIHSHIAKQPIPPNVLNSNIPEYIARIVMKLLEKKPENRYQSYNGLSMDIEECRRRNDSGLRESFKIGVNDRRRVFRIPSQLYGRESEIKALMKSLDRAQGDGRSLVVVSGYSGVGKSSLVREILKPIFNKKGVFTFGKLDQFRKYVPYHAIIAVLKELTDYIISGSEDSVRNWGEILRNSLGKNGNILIEILPELEHIIGKQEMVPQLPSSEAQNRFYNAVKVLIQSVTATGIPLVMFIDDIQWADQNSLKLIYYLLSSKDLKKIMIICTYRDNTIFTSHPFLELINTLSCNESVLTTRIELKSLNRDIVKKIISDVISRDEETTKKLADYCFEKTGGNPYFLNQFLCSLHENQLIYFNDNKDRWEIDFSKIKELPVTDNVVDLLIGKIRKLDIKLQKLLQLASCIGNEFNLHVLSIIADKNLVEVIQCLWIGVKEGFIQPCSNNYRVATLKKTTVDVEKILVYSFIHDRVFQAVYNEMNEQCKVEIHSKIGQIMLKEFYNNGNNERIFDILQHLNKGAPLIVKPIVRVEYARLNLNAGKRAILSSAYLFALSYFKAGIALLNKDAWTYHYALCLELYTNAAISANICALDDDMENYSNEVLTHAKQDCDTLEIYEMKIHAYTSRNNHSKAIDIAIQILGKMGVFFPRKPSKLQVVLNYYKLKMFLTKKKRNNILNLNQCYDPVILSIQNIILRMATAAYFFEPELQTLSTFRRIEYSFRFGNSGASTTAYGGYAVVLALLGKYNESYNFGKISLALLDKLGGTEYQARVLFYWGAFIRHWKEPLYLCAKNLSDAYQIALNNGDVDYISYTAFTYTYTSIIMGKPLAALEKEAEGYRVVLKQYKQNFGLQIMNFYQQTIKTLIGKTDYSDRIKGDLFDEDEVFPEFIKERHYTGISGGAVCKIIVAYHSDNMEEALRSSNLFERYKSGIKSTANLPVFYFYDSLVRARLCGTDHSHRKIHMKHLKRNINRLRIWATHCPDNCLQKQYCAQAELFRLQGKEQKAAILYEKAIKYAKKHRFVNDEAIASELAARYYLEKGQVRIGGLFMIDAYNAYNKWGMSICCKRIKEECSKLLSFYSSSDQNGSAVTSTDCLMNTQQYNDNLDIHSISKASNAIARHIHLDDLLVSLMTILIENAVAQKGVLLLSNKGLLTIEAEASADNGDVRLLHGIPIASYNDIPVSIINYVWRTGETVVINDEVNHEQFMSDEYITQVKPKSILCSPIINKNSTIGIYYLENKMLSAAFTEDQINVLNLLSSQMGISIENATLYEKLKDYNRTLKKKVEDRTAELRGAFQKIQQLAMIDPLTNLSNRRHIISILEYEKGRTQRSGNPFCLIMGDVDNFKTFNDTNGHDCGDFVLVSLASIFKNTLRKQDHISRWGGEEFLFVLPETTLENGRIIAEKLKHKIEKTVLYYNEQEITITMTFGITYFSEEVDVSDCIKQADVALYNGKNTGRNRVVVFEKRKEVAHAI